MKVVGLRDLLVCLQPKRDPTRRESGMLCRCEYRETFRTLTMHYRGGNMCNECKDNCMKGKVGQSAEKPIGNAPECLSMVGRTDHDVLDCSSVPRV